MISTIPQSKKLRLGDMLVSGGLLTQEQLEVGLAQQAKTRRRLGETLVELGMVTEEDIINVLELQFGIQRIDLRGVRIEPEVIGLVSGSVLRRHNVLPVAFEHNSLILAMSNPMDMVAQDDIAIIANCVVEPRIAAAGEINAVLDRYFGTGEAMSAAEQYTREREPQLQQLAEDAAAAQAELDEMI